MRVAISGTHFSGKSTLITSLLKQLPHYVAVEEPYILLEEQGYEFSNPPALEDFELQFERSIRTILESKSCTIFDRCPLDLLAYALALGDLVDIENWSLKMKDAIRLLDLIVYIPIENRDRIRVPASEDLELRRNVDENLQDMLLDDSLGILENTEILEIIGSLEKRVKMVISRLQEDSNDK